LEKTRIIGLIVLVLQIGSVLAFIASGYTIYQVLASSLPQQGMKAPLKIERKGETSEIILTLNPVNRGYMPVSLSLGLSANILGEQVASDNTSLTLTPGIGEEIVLNLVVSADRVEQIFDDEGSMDLKLSVRTMGDLVAFSLNTHVEGGMTQ